MASVTRRKRATFLISFGFWQGKGHSHIFQVRTSDRFYNLRIKTGANVYLKDGYRRVHWTGRGRIWDVSLTLPRHLTLRIRSGQHHVSSPPLD